MPRNLSPSDLEKLQEPRLSKAEALCFAAVKTSSCPSCRARLVSRRPLDERSDSAEKNLSKDAGMRRFGLLLIIGVMMASSSGCALMHEMQPHRLWRWNRGPSHSSDPYFSVSDPIPDSAFQRQAIDFDEAPVADLD